MTAGSYAFRATYNGDTNYNVSTSGCEPFTVNKADTANVTTLHNANHDVIPNGGSVPLGTIMHDSATVSGTGAGTPTGNVTFTFYSAATDCTGASVGAGTVNLVGGVAHPSNSEGPLAVGGYSFRAVYSGDTNYNPSTSACEPFTVVKADTSTVTQIHNGDNHNTNVSNVPLGSTVHDSATVTGTAFGVPTGNVTFTFFTTATDCTGPSVGAGTVNLVNGVAHPSQSEGPLGAGSYSFLAVYNGDGNYNPSTAQCEPLTVAKADTSSVTAIHNDANHNVIPNGSSVPLGTKVHDSATVTGTAFGVPTGTVTFTFFTASGDCTGASVGAGTVPLGINGVADPSQTQGPLAAGTVLVPRRLQRRQQLRGVHLGL